MTIDWSKAPEWATKHGFVSPEMLPVWLSTHQYRYVDERQSGRSFSLINKEGYTIDQVMNISLRPVVSGWTGEGLPPVGAIVEVVDDDRFNIRTESSDFIGKTVRVAASFVMNESGKKMVCVDGGTNLGCEVFILELIKPVRTAEQIAAEEIQAIEQWLDSNIEDLGPVAKALHEFGYRKQEQK